MMLLLRHSILLLAAESGHRKRINDTQKEVVQRNHDKQERDLKVLIVTETLGVIHLTKWMFGVFFLAL